MLLIPLLGALLGLAAGAFPFFRVFTANRSIRAEVAVVPEPKLPLTPEDLTPAELAYLVGGATRVGEVAFMDLFLSGRIRRQVRSGFFTLVGPSNAYVTEKDPVRRDLVKAFRDRTGLTARGLIQTATSSRGIDRVREKLADRSLIARSEGLAKVLADFHSGGWISRVLAYSGVALFAVGVVLTNAYERDAWTVALAVLGGVLAVLGGLARGLYLGHGGRNASTATAAGKRLLGAATDTYEAAAAEGRTMGREEALRYTAVLGISRMGREASPRDWGRDGSGDDAVRVVTHTGSAQVLEESPRRVGEQTPEPREGFELDWGSLCEIADLCAGDGSGSASSGGSSGGDSGGGGFWGGGDSGGSGGDGGGGGGGD
ncbi:TIGR04222 domain-containing membrane protein [Nocardiopsis terrae]